MGILNITSRIVNILVGLAALAEKSKPYIKRHKEQTEKDPSASLAAMDYLERPSYEEHDVYRALNVLAKECDFIQSEAFKNSNFLTARNDGILYYDCTNYYSELEQEDGVKTYGKRKAERKNPNDPVRFVGKMAVTKDGEAAGIQYYLDEEKIAEEARYDGPYAVCTDLLDDNVAPILKVIEERWRIEECFRIMKTDFEARPAFVRLENRIKAHFLTCFLALLVYRILEKSWEATIPVKKF